MTKRDSLLKKYKDENFLTMSYKSKKTGTNEQNLRDVWKDQAGFFTHTNLTLCHPFSPSASILICKKRRKVI